MLVIWMDRRQGCRTFRTCTIRINPCMKFHVALVTLINHPLQRIPLRRFPLYSSQIAAPWLITRLVKRIRFCTYLKNNGIDTSFLQSIELSSQYTLHLLCSHSLKLSVHTLNPSSTEFTLGGFRLGRHRKCQHTCSHRQ